MLSCRRVFFIAIAIFWSVTMGLLINRHYSLFRHTAPILFKNTFTSSDISEEQWMGVYFSGEKIGYLSRKMTRTNNGYLMDETFRIRMLVMGKTKDIETLLNANLDNDLKLSSFTAKIKADFVLDISGKVKGKNLYLAINSAGVKSAKVIHFDKEPALEGPAMSKMLIGKKPGDRISIPVFDPSLIGIADLELNIKAKEQLMSLGKMQETYKVIGNMKGIEFTAWVTESGEVLKEESPMGFLLVKETREDALKIGKPSLDLISQSAVPLKMKLPSDISYLKVRISGIDLKGLELDGGRQKLKGDVLEINREVIRSAMKMQRPAVIAKEFDECLKDTTFIQSKDPQIVRLAKEITKNEKNPIVSARLIYEWVYRNIEKTPTITIPMATDVLKTKKGDCNEHTTLYTALARAAGIPARIAVGLTYKDGFFYYHAWPEFFAGQWIAADPTLGQFPADASHIRLMTGDIDKQIQILPVINKIHIEGLEYR